LEARLPLYRGSGTLSIQLKIRELSKRVMMVWKFLWNVSEKSERFLIFSIRTIQPKIQEILGEKLSGKKILIEEFSKCCSFRHRKFP